MSDAPPYSTLHGRTGLTSEEYDEILRRPSARLRLTPPRPEAATREEFTSWMAWRYRERCKGLSLARSLEFAEATLSSYLDDENIEFGSSDHGWSQADAHTMADDDMECWET